MSTDYRCLSETGEHCACRVEGRACCLCETPLGMTPDYLPCTENGRRGWLDNYGQFFPVQCQQERIRQYTDG